MVLGNCLVWWFKVTLDIITFKYLCEKRNISLFSFCILFDPFYGWNGEKTTTEKTRTQKNNNVKLYIKKSRQSFQSWRWDSRVCVCVYVCVCVCVCVCGCKFKDSQFEQFCKSLELKVEAEVAQLSLWFWEVFLVKAKRFIKTFPVIREILFLIDSWYPKMVWQNDYN